ncbi:hypothetical protein EE612_027557 [Oryza sativa]|nr:hypothetical protein EE612_027557 [Oryza sativa]
MELILFLPYPLLADRARSEERGRRRAAAEGGARWWPVGPSHEDVSGWCGGRTWCSAMRFFFFYPL